MIYTSTILLLIMSTGTSLGTSLTGRLAELAHEFGPKGVEVVEQLVSLAGGQQEFESLLPFPLPD
ncbi:unnamed protein product, partial [Oppiella nova]